MSVSRGKLARAEPRSELKVDWRKDFKMGAWTPYKVGVRELFFGMEVQIGCITQSTCRVTMMQTSAVRSTPTFNVSYSSSFENRLINIIRIHQGIDCS